MLDFPFVSFFFESQKCMEQFPQFWVLEEFTNYFILNAILLLLLYV